jgi:hypothetical protein
VDLEALGKEAAVELLREVCEESPKWDDDQIRCLTELCGCNALCLTIVGSFINAERCTLKVCERELAMMQRSFFPFLHV